MRSLLNKVKNKYNYWLKSTCNIHRDASATVNISKNNTHCIGQISVGENAILIIDENVSFNGRIRMGKNTSLHIKKNSHFTNVIFDIQNSGKVLLESNCRMEVPEMKICYLAIDNGQLHIKEHAHIQSDILVRFGGQLNIGSYTSINHSSEIRCEEKIEIGDFCLISYEVCIYDTNAHSTDAEKRREAILRDGQEIERPATKPIFIGNDCWIGKGATILKGTTIGAKSIVGIRTIVTSGIYDDNSRIVSPKPIVLK